MDAVRGDRYGKVKHPYGIERGISTHGEDLSEGEIAKLGAELFASMGPKGACPE